MATMEKERSTGSEQRITDPSQSAVPTPFPASSLTNTATEERARSTSRARESLLNKFKRAMSRDRSPGLVRRESLTNTPLSVERLTNEDERGRSRDPAPVHDSSLSTKSATTDATAAAAGLPSYEQKEKEGILKTISRSLSPASRATGTTLATGTERGRTKFQATGRGGAGNMVVSPDRGEEGSSARDPSLDRVISRRAADESPEDVARARNAQAERSTSRGRQAPLATTGRGGAGNLRSSSRGRTIEESLAEAREDEKERELLEKARARAMNGPSFGGRGGRGNIVIGSGAKQAPQ